MDHIGSYGFTLPWPTLVRWFRGNVPFLVWWLRGTVLYLSWFVLFRSNVTSLDPMFFHVLCHTLVPLVTKWLRGAAIHLCSTVPMYCGPSWFLWCMWPTLVLMIRGYCESWLRWFWRTSYVNHFGSHGSEVLWPTLVPMVPRYCAFAKSAFITSSRWMLKSVTIVWTDRLLAHTPIQTTFTQIYNYGAYRYVYNCTSRHNQFQYIILN